MKAVTYTSYGAPEVLSVTEVERPIINENEMLIKVAATSVSAGDWRMRKAEPFAIRFVSGLTKPKHPVLGHEFAGTVVKTGRKVSDFVIGDKVFGSTGFKPGTYAEYLAIADDGIICKLPPNISFTDAASVPTGALTALYFLKQAKLKSGDRVLIHGASGSVGTAAVQIANKYFGAHVTAVCSASNSDLVRSLGADVVVDYTKDDFTDAHEPYDVIFSTVGKTSYKEAKAALTDQGRFVSCDATMSDYWYQLLGEFYGEHKVIAGIAKEHKEGLDLISSMIVQGRFVPVVDRVFKMEEMPKAHAYVEAGHKKGNVVVTINSQSHDK